MELKLDTLNGLTLDQMNDIGYKLVVYRMFWNQVFMKFLPTHSGGEAGNHGILEIYQDRSEKDNSIVGYKITALGENDIEVWAQGYEWRPLPGGVDRVGSISLTSLRFERLIDLEKSAQGSLGRFYNYSNGVAQYQLYH